MNQERMTAALESIRALCEAAKSRAPQDAEPEDFYTQGMVNADSILSIIERAACPHDSASGIDTYFGPDKVWRCDHCGLLWRQDEEPLTITDLANAEDQP